MDLDFSLTTETFLEQSIQSSTMSKDLKPILSYFCKVELLQAESIEKMPTRHRIHLESALLTWAYCSRFWHRDANHPTSQAKNEN